MFSINQCSLRSRAIFFFLLCIFFSNAGNAKCWYVSPLTNKSGWRENGEGTDKNPWDLQTALSGGNGKVMPGDTIYLHDGTPYWGYMIIEINGALVFAPQLYTCHLNGKENAPIIVKAYPGEHPVIDGSTCTTPEAFAADKNAGIKLSNASLVISGSYIWIWGLEITNSSHTRESSITDGGGGTGGVFVSDGDHIKLINLIVHDNSETGISAFRGAKNVEIEGCLIYYNGYVAIKPKDAATTGGGYKTYGPGIYIQNRSDSTGYSKKTIRNNIIFEQFYNGVQIYGSSLSFIQNYDFVGNTIFNNGLICKATEDATTIHADYNLIVGGKTDGWDLNISNNQICYFSKYGAKANAKIGYNENSVIHHCKIDSNYFVSGVTYPAIVVPPLIVNNVVDGDFEHNMIYGFTAYAIMNYNKSLLKNIYLNIGKQFHSDYNTFINCMEGTSEKLPPAPILFKYENSGGYDPVSWSDTFKLDRHSSNIYLGDIKKKKVEGALKIIITPDAYEPGLAKVVIFNWDSLREISFSVSDIIPAGNAFYCNDIQNYKSAIPESAPYKGEINLKMAALKTTVPTGLAGSPAMVQPEHTDARFGVYWLQYFPYKLKLEVRNRIVECKFMDVKENVIQNPPFLTYSWKKDDKILDHENSYKCPINGDGIYELTVTDDKNLQKEVHSLVVNGKISSK